MKKIIFPLILLLFTLSSLGYAYDLRYRLVYIQKNFIHANSVSDTENIMRRAKTAGYNGIVLTDSKFENFDDQNTTYFKNLQAVIKTAQDLGLDIYPATIDPGYANGLLRYDPNLIESTPVQDALFIVHHGEAKIAADGPLELKNGGFESSKGNRLEGWQFQDTPGVYTFVDSAIYHDGEQSVRMEHPVDEAQEGVRIAQWVSVYPFRQYHLSFWIKTENFKVSPGRLAVSIMTGPGHNLDYIGIKAAATQEWTKYDIAFNSLANEKVGFYCGVWDKNMKGQIWWDDFRLEEIGLVNVVRRSGCPLIVKGEDGTIYHEGQDFEPIKDPQMGTVPYSGSYEPYHPSLSIRLSSQSRIREGERLRVSYYQAGIVGNNQVAICLSEPKTDKIIAKILTQVNQLFKPKGLFLDYNEQRILNWDEDCQSRHLTPGQILADQVRRTIAQEREINPEGKVFIWSDLFDPFMNARDNYYQVNGSYKGSWEGLSSNVIVVNWSFSKHMAESLQWFDQLGHQQILAGYYDGSANLKTWLDKVKNDSHVIGVMYTTWKNNYNDLETFARAAWGNS